MSRDEAACVELVFSRGPSESRRAKAKSLWTFLDSQTELKLHVPRHASTKTTESKDSDGNTAEKHVHVGLTAQDARYPWYEGLCILRHLGLDKVALATKDACGDRRQLHNDGNVTHDKGRLVDDTEEPYDVINSELRAFEERVKKDRAINSAKRIYETPEKYERFCSRLSDDNAVSPATSSRNT